MSGGRRDWGVNNEKLSHIALKFFNPTQLKFIKFFTQGYHAN